MKFTSGMLSKWLVAGMRVLLVLSLLLSPIARAEIEDPAKSTATLAGIVLPADVRPGDRVSGSVVDDTKPYEEMPGLQVIKIPPSMLTGRTATLSGVVVDTGEKEPQSAEQPIVFTVPESSSHIRMALRREDQPKLCSRISVGVALKSRVEREKFDCPPVVTPGGVQMIHGPFDGNSDQTIVDIGGRPAEVIAESPREAYVTVPYDLPAGQNEMTVIDGSHFAKLPVFVLDLAMSADQLTLRTGQTTKFHVVVSGPEQMPDSAWQAGIPSELLDVAKLDRTFPDFNPPNPGEKGVVLLRIENMVPGVISMKDSKNEVINIELDQKSFAKGPFRYDGTIKSKREGGFNINGTVIAFLAPVTGEEREVPQEETDPPSENPDGESFHQEVADRLLQLSRDTKEACSRITDPEKREELEEFAKYLEDKAREVEISSGLISEETLDLLYNCQSNEDSVLIKMKKEAYEKYLETLDPKIKAQMDQLQREREELKKKAEDAQLKADQANIQKYDPDKKKKHDDAYKDWLKARDKVKELTKTAEDARQKAEDSAKNPKTAKGTEFGDYEQAKKDLAAANAEFEKAREVWDQAYVENQKAINPDLKKQEDQARKDAKAAMDEFKKKTDDYLKKIEEYDKSGDQKLYKEYKKLQEQYLNPPDAKT